MTKSRKSAGCNKRNTSATLLMLHPVATEGATNGCSERNSPNPGNLRGATRATLAQHQKLLRTFPNLRVRQKGRNTPRNSPSIEGRCGVAPLGAAIGLLRKRSGAGSDLFSLSSSPVLSARGFREYRESSHFCGSF
jgi:hypothetical protein